ncbi:MAG TPA: septal ring lytic transglycosylase RlpA family protein [Verrucomicrobiae bacterium]|jgi:rare lipoprotein A|nr:septal ring lytic transglycosylase RlpA family protein [Verrucomicrobiae bacterium]
MKKTAFKPAVPLLWCCAFIFAAAPVAHAELVQKSQQQGFASWYGEEHRGRLMANGHRFDPDKFTAASWFYPLGTHVRVTISSPHFESRSVMVTITDRGPAKDLVQQGRVIDLGRAAFQKIAHPDLGLVAVVVEPVR